jgi:hypothetical protein
MTALEISSLYTAVFSLGDQVPALSSVFCHLWYTAAYFLLTPLDTFLPLATEGSVVDWQVEGVQGVQEIR